MPRPKLPEKRRRTATVFFRVTERERRALSRCARAVRMTVAAYARASVLADVLVQSRESKESRELGRRMRETQDRS